MERKARVTLKDLAGRLGLSQTTVSVVVNGSPAAQAIPEATRNRILAAAQKLNYRANYFARSLSSRNSMSVGILAPELSEGYFTLVMNGLEDCLQSMRYFYFLACHNWNEDLRKSYPGMLIDRAVDGLIFLNTPVPMPVEVPTVSISGQETLRGVTNVHLDHKSAAMLAINHLRDLGHRRVSFMKGQRFTVDTEARWENIIEVARGAGLTIHPELNISLEINSWSPELGYEPVKRLLSRTRDFTAIFCFNDTSAQGAIRALHEEGLCVPRDVSVIGFDDIMSAKFGIPSLTTVRQPLRQMGHTAAEALLKRIACPEARYPKKILLQPELMIRESTGPAPRKGGGASARQVISSSLV